MRWLRRAKRWLKSRGLWRRDRIPATRIAELATLTDELLGSSTRCDPWSRAPEQIAKDEQAMRDAMRATGTLQNSPMTACALSAVEMASRLQLAHGSPSSAECGMDGLVRRIDAPTVKVSGAAPLCPSYYGLPTAKAKYVSNAVDGLNRQLRALGWTRKGLDRALEGVEVYRTASGRWKWRIRRDGEIMRVSPKTYSRKWTAMRGWERAKRADA